MATNEIEEYKQQITKQLERLTQYLQKYALGDFSKSIKIPDQENEFTELLVGLNLMVDDIKELIKEKEEIISNLVETQNALKENEEKLRVLFDGTYDLVSLTDDKVKTIYANAAWKREFGEDLDKQEDPFKLIHPDDLGEVGKQWSALVSEDKNIQELVYRFKVDDGIYHYFETSAFAVMIEDKRYYYVIARDITERKQAEENITRQSAILEAINTVFQEALTCETEEELGKTCLAVAEKLTSSKFGFFGELNPAGLMDDIAISNPGWDACKMAVSDARRFIKDMPIRGIDRSTIRDEKSRIVNEEDMQTHTDRVGTPKGHPKITAFLGVPLKHEGKTIGMIGLGNKKGGYNLYDQKAIEDLSTAIVEALRSKRTEEKLKEYSENLEKMVRERTLELRDAQEELVRKEKLGVLGQLAGGVGHELRNPLGAIKSAVYFLKMALEKPDPEIKETLEILDTEVKASETIIKSLLDFARPGIPVKKEVSINGVVEQALSRVEVPEKVHLSTRLNPNLPVNPVDSDRMVRVFENLIRNAIDAMPEGENLSITTEPGEDGKVLISMEDTGGGILEEDLEKVFEPLYTKKAKGIGLGLALSKILVEGNGGNIEAESVTGKGSKFIVILPTEVEGKQNNTELGDLCSGRPSSTSSA